MKAFHNDPAIKAKYLERVIAHRKADRLIRGQGWDREKDGVHRGCAVGCTLENYSHRAYETELGIPEVLAHLEDRIFENLPTEAEWSAFPAEFLTAIPVGANLRYVWPRFAVWLLSDPVHGTKQYCRPDGVKATDRVVGLFESAIRGDAVKASEWNAASYAAAYAAAYAAVVHAADASAYAAAYAADASAYAAAYAADAANARGKFWTAASQKLLQLLREAPISV